MADEVQTPIYANVVNISAGPFDVTMDFGYKSPEKMAKGSADYDVVVRVVMGLGHAKSMIPLLARVIATYEQQVGPITAPGFEGDARQ